MSRSKVIVALPLSESQLRSVTEAGADAEIAYWPEGIPTGGSSEGDAERLTFLREAEALITFRLPREAVQNLPSLAPALRWVQLSYAGVEPSLARTLGDAGIRVSNASGVHAIQIAEFAISALLLLTKGWPELFAAQRERRWARPPARELYGSTLCVVGLGRVGSAVARYAAALGMRVTAVRRRSDAPVGGHAGPVPRATELAIESGPAPTGSEIAQLYSIDDLAQALGDADYVLNALPATAETESAFDARTFSMMRDGAFFVNIGRGSTVDEPALVEALRSGKLAGAVLDVFRTEPLPADSPLWDVPNLVVSPHISGASPRYMDRAAELFAENLRRFLSGAPLLNIVDPVRGY